MGDSGEAVQDGIATLASQHTMFVEAASLIGMSARVAATFENSAMVAGVSDLIDKGKLKALDKTLPLRFGGYSGTGGSRRRLDLSLDIIGRAQAVGDFGKFGIGNTETQLCNHSWKLCKMVNSTDGSYAAKAKSAIAAEAQSFDVSFYRLQRKDPKQATSYVLSQIMSSDEYLYLSFFKEAISYSLHRKVVASQLIGGNYGDGILTKGEYRTQENFFDVAVNAAVPGGDENINGEVFRVQRNNVENGQNIVVVNRSPPWGLLPPQNPQPQGRGQVQDLTTVTFVPMEEICEAVMDGLFDDGANVFVSNATTANDYARDIIALYCGSRREFGLFDDNVIMVVSRVSPGDWKNWMSSLGMRDTRTGCLNVIASYLHSRVRIRIPEGYYRCSGCDLLRVREWYAHNFSGGGKLTIEIFASTNSHMTHQCSILILTGWPG